MNRFQSYLDALARANGLSRDTQWLFYPGMLQDSPVKWWDDFLFRQALHEGIDICYYRNGTEKGIQTVPDLKVPALDQGIVRNVTSDFLGKSLVLEHRGFCGFPDRVIFVYSHLSPAPGIKPGTGVEKDQILAQVFDTRIKQSKLLSHLHLSCIEIPRSIPMDRLTWDFFPRRDQVRFINPVFI